MPDPLLQNIQAEAPSFLSNVFQGPLLQTALALITSRLVPTLAKGFGACNGINVNGGNGAKGVSLKEFTSQYPGTFLLWQRLGSQTDLGSLFAGYKFFSSGPRALSPAP